jgi:hypothetical protein
MLGVYAYEISNYTQPFKGPEIRDRHKVKHVVKAAEHSRHWENSTISE